MIRRYGTRLRLLLMVGDVLVTAAFAVVLSSVMFGSLAQATWDAAVPNPPLALLLYVSLWVVILWSHDLYRLRARWSIRSEAAGVLRAIIWLGLATITVLYFTRHDDVSRLYVIALLIGLYAVTIAERAGIRWLLEHERRKGRNARYVLMLGTGPVARAFASKLEDHPELGLRIVGFLGPQASLPRGWSYLGGYELLPTVAHDRVIDEVAICLGSEDWRLVDEVVALCEAEGKIARMPVPLPALTVAHSHVEDLDGMPVVSFVTGPLPPVALASKRAIDVLCAGLGMVVLSPLFLGLAIAVLIAEGRPIFFRQERVGLNGRNFRVVKFRTMVKDAESRLAALADANEINGHAFKVTADPRITRFGRFLRRSSLDELPQLWNVLKGEMSMVGPRPPLPQEVVGYDLWHRRRLSMKPGITGLWQIEGRHEPEFDRWVRKDLEYIDRWSPWLDIQILIRTIPALIRAQGR